MNRPQGPLSPPISVASSEWSRHQSSSSGAYPQNLSPNNNNNNNNGRGNTLTPPVSGSLNGSNGSFTNGMNGPNGMNGRPGDYRGNPSPPASVGRLSNGANLSMDPHRRKQSIVEDSLAQHYSVLKRYLAQSLREEQADGKPNRARDKLLRLSPVQFQELSTDVYDELLRRQSSAAGQQVNRPSEVPNFLLPKQGFHPKRNQARQKLSTLPPPRFRALATDVFFELERRFPTFSGAGIDRRNSPANSMRGPPSRTGTPVGMRPSSRDQQNRPLPPRNNSLGGQALGGLGIPGMGSQDDYNRPTAKSSQSNTIVPNKSYLIEDDDEDADDIYAMSRRDTGMTNQSYGASDRDKKAIADYQNKVDDLQGKMEDLERQVGMKNATIQRHEEREKDIDAVGQPIRSPVLFANTTTRHRKSGLLYAQVWKRSSRMLST